MPTPARWTELGLGDAGRERHECRRRGGLTSDASSRWMDDGAEKKERAARVRTAPGRGARGGNQLDEGDKPQKLSHTVRLLNCTSTRSYS